MENATNHDWAIAAKQAFHDRDEAKHKLREAEKQISVIKENKLASLEHFKNLGFVEDILISPNFQLCLMNHVFSDILASDRIIDRLDVPASVVLNFWGFGRTIWDEANSREMRNGLMGHFLSADVYLDNNIMPFTKNIPGNKTYSVSPKSEESVVCRLFMSPLIAEMPTKWMTPSKG